MNALDILHYSSILQQAAVVCMSATGKRYFKCGGPMYVVFYNKLSWFVSELPEEDISNVVV